MMNNKVIITAALTGAVHTPSMSPYLPITPQEIIDEGIRSYNAGAAVVHLHARNPENGKPSTDPLLMREIVEGIKKKCDVIQCISTGEGLTSAERAGVIKELKPECASLNFGSLNLALHDYANKITSYKYDWEKPYFEETEDYVFANSFKSIRELSEIFRETDTKPEIELYDIGMINNLSYMINKGFVSQVPNIQFVMGGLGAIPATPKNLVNMLDISKEQIGNFNWCVASAGRTQFTLGTMAVIMGGNVRVGLEDNLYLSKGILAKSNAEQVEKIVSLIRLLGFEPATSEEARKVLGLKGLSQVNF
jgi:uncharacterized protein (DUF849 family)